MDKIYVVEFRAVLSVSASNEEEALERANVCFLEDFEKDGLGIDPRIIYVEDPNEVRKLALGEMRDYLNGLHNELVAFNPAGVDALNMVKAWVKAKIGMLKG
jgi:hypothetical protein